jgi:hypothetical protein
MDIVANVRMPVCSCREQNTGLHVTLLIELSRFLLTQGREREREGVIDVFRLTLLSISRVI